MRSSILRPYIHLGDIDRIDLLRNLFDAIETPMAVAEEIRAKGDEDRAARALAAAPWLKVVTTPEPSAPLLAWDLGAGETSVLALALSRPGSEAVIDDLAARRCAKTFGIPVCGTLGLVLRAARKGIVSDPVGILNQLRSAGMWLNPGLFEQVLSMARLRDALTHIRLPGNAVGRRCIPMRLLSFQLRPEHGSPVSPNHPAVGVHTQ